MGQDKTISIRVNLQNLLDKKSYLKLKSKIPKARILNKIKNEI